MSGAPASALVALGLLALLTAALLSAGETAVLRLSRSALAEIGSSSLPSGRRVRRLAEDAPATASAAGLVSTVFEVVALVFLTVAIAATDRSWWQVLVLALMLGVTASALVARAWPRHLGREHPGQTLVLTAGLLTVARALTRPLGRAGRVGDERYELTDAEIRDMVDRVSESEHMEEEEREMFRSVLELRDTITRAVMVPRTEMITLPAGTPLRKALSLFLRSGYSRVPVVGESVDDLVGIVYLKDVVRHRYAAGGSDDLAVDDLVRPAVFVPESKPVDDLLRDMQQGAFHMAMVVDEYGGIAGLVTIEDALEEIVGELTDEHDRSGPEVEELAEGVYRVPSRMPIDELGELFDVELEDEDVDTAGGLLAKALGKVPLSGSSAQVGALVLTADQVEGRRRQVATLVARRADVPGPVEGAPPAGQPARQQQSGATNQGAHR